MEVSDSSFERQKTAESVQEAINLLTKQNEGDPQVEQLRRIVADRIQALFDTDEYKSNVQRVFLNGFADKIRVKSIVHRIQE